LTPESVSDRGPLIVMPGREDAVLGDEPL